MIHIDAQHLTLCSHLCIRFGNRIIIMPEIYPKELQVPAADEEACRECMPEQMRMEPIYAGLSFYVLKQLLNGILGNRFTVFQSPENNAAAMACQL